MPKASATLNPATGPLLPRLFNALFLRREFYESVAATPGATGPAGAVVCLAAIARESVGLYEISQGFKAWGLVLVVIVVFALLRWLAYSAVMYPVARLISGRKVGYATLLRCLGFAETPAVASLAAFLVGDDLYPFIKFAVGAWLLLATIVAVRAAAGVTTARAVAIGIVGFAAYLGIGLAVDFVASTAAPPAEAPAALTLRGGV